MTTYAPVRQRQRGDASDNSARNLVGPTGNHPRLDTVLTRNPNHNSIDCDYIEDGCGEA